MVASTHPDWLLWQLADSAFPTGGFAHSSGLEAAWQQGEVRSGEGLGQFIEASLWQLGNCPLPLMTAAHSGAASLDSLDRLCEACTTSHVANRASRLQGRALLASAKRIFAAAALDAAPVYGHWAPVFGTLARALGTGLEPARRLFFFQHLRGLAASAVRLGMVGPMEAQALQHRLGPVAERIMESCRGLGISDIAQTAPLQEIWQTGQDRLYSRLFQS